jgi:DmsE family decaheme c-type cytochrome
MRQRDGRRFLRAVSAAALAATAGAVLLLAQTATPTPTPGAAATTPAAGPATTPGAAPTNGPEGAAAAATTPAAPEELPKCADCHTDLVAAFASNPHARTPHGQKKGDINDFCSTCHGDGTKHMEAGGDASLIDKPKGLTGSEDCKACHQSAHGPHDSFDTGVHSNTAAVNCLTCHSIHKAIAKSPFLLAQAPGKLCATCHTTESASFENKPYAHRLNRGGMTCLDCHSPHATRGQTVKMTVQGELPCLSCHAEKRGPFVFQHVSGSGGDCLSCHQPHGSNNPNMLLWARVDQLCLSCHSQTPPPKTYGSQPPSFHDLTLPRYRNCTTCHVAVHGSNVSPQLLK